MDVVFLKEMHKSYFLYGTMFLFLSIFSLELEATVVQCIIHNPVQLATFCTTFFSPSSKSVLLQVERICSSVLIEIRQKINQNPKGR